MITGLRGLLFTSATGAKFTWTPSARDSIAGDSRFFADQPHDRRRRAIAPIAICRGNAVAPNIRNPTPVSKSAVFSSGTVDIACRRLIRNAAENGWPRITVP